MLPQRHRLRKRASQKPRKRTPTPAAEPVTAAQRRALFGRASALGFNHQDLRDLTSSGSVARLSRVEADERLARLAGRRGPLSGAPESEEVGTASARQRGLLLHLAAVVGFAERAFRQWLCQRYEVASVDELDADTARRAIGALLHMIERRAGLDARRFRRRRGGHD